MPTFKLTIDVECDVSETVSEFTHKPQEIISKLAMIDAIRQNLPNGARVNLFAQLEDERTGKLYRASPNLTADPISRLL